MKKLSLLLLFVSTVSFAQGLDFETTNFEIKAITLTNSPRTLLSYDLTKEEVPSRLKKFDSRSRQDIYNASQSFIYAVRNNFKTPDTKNPTISIAPLTKKEIYAFGDDGAINGVKNIAYKPSSGGNIYSAYCAGVYAASRAQN